MEGGRGEIIYFHFFVCGFWLGEVGDEPLEKRKVLEYKQDFHRAAVPGVRASRDTAR